MPAPITGIGGDVLFGGTGVAHVRKFVITKKAANQQYASSDTSGWKKAAKGIRSWSATVDVYFESGELTITATEIEDLVGTAIKVQFTFANGVTTPSALPGANNALIDSISNIVVDIETGNVVGATLTLRGKGQLAA